jgi:hypothetical protein
MHRFTAFHFISCLRMAALEPSGYDVLANYVPDRQVTQSDTNDVGSSATPTRLIDGDNAQQQHKILIHTTARTTA